MKLIAVQNIWNRQSYRHTKEIQTNNVKERQKLKHTEIKSDKQMDSQTNIQRAKHTFIYTDSQTCRLTVRHTENSHYIMHINI